MDLITPDFGLVFWTTVIFLVLLILLSKFAWKPIMRGIDQRNKSIEEALQSAENTKQEMAQLQAENEIILQKAKKERNNLLQEARDTKEQMIAQAQQEARDEADKIMQKAVSSIEAEKQKAIVELKNTVGELSIEIAEKILKQELTDKKVSDNIISQSIKELKMN
ncbi:MAG: F0F1 ATP synthase subunit B [Bacteroidales bacterium]